MSIELKDLQKKDFAKAIGYAVTGMHFERYTQNRMLLKIYGRPGDGTGHTDHCGEGEALHPVFTDNNCTWQFYEHKGFERVGEKEIRMDIAGADVPLTCLLYAKTCVKPVS